MKIRQVKQRARLLLLAALVALIFVSIKQQSVNISETYMSCVAPRISSVNSLLNVESDKCSVGVLSALYDPKGRFRRDCTAVNGACVEWVTYSTKCSHNLNRLAVGRLI